MLQMGMVEQALQTHARIQTSVRRGREKCGGNFPSATSSLLVIVTVSTVLLCPALCNPVPSEDVVRIKEFSFSEKLKNPCALANASSLERGSRSPEERLATRKTLVKELKAKVMLLNDSAATILRTNVLHDCSALRLPLVAIVPTAEEILNSQPVEVLRLYYTSLLNHTAHVLFISEQLDRYAGQTCNSDGLPASAKTLGSNMRELMCILRLCIMTLQKDTDEVDDVAYFVDSTAQILNEYLMDQPLCSRRSVRDCQTVYSTVTLLTEFSSYLQNRVLITDEDPS